MCVWNVYLTLSVTLVEGQAVCHNDTIIQLNIQRQKAHKYETKGHVEYFSFKEPLLSQEIMRCLLFSIFTVVINLYHTKSKHCIYSNKVRVVYVY